MKLISLFRHREGDNTIRAYINIFLADSQATRFGFGLHMLYPLYPLLPRMMPKFDSFTEELHPHYFCFGFSFRWRAKHIRGRRMFLKFPRFWLHQK